MANIHRVLVSCALQVCAIVPLVFGSAATQAADTVTCPHRPRSLFEQRLLEKADQGDAALRRFIERKAESRPLDIDQTMARAERLRRERDACEIHPVDGG